MKHPWRIAAGLVAVVLATLVGVSYLPVSEEDLPKTRAAVEYHNYFTIDIDGKETLFFTFRDGATTLAGLSADSLKRTETRVKAACWVNKFSLFPSCHGTLLLAADSVARDSLAAQTEVLLDTLMWHSAVSLREMERQISDYLEDMKYYISVHGLQDEGYDYISQCYSRMLERQEQIMKTLDAVVSVDSVLKESRELVHVTPHTDFKAYYYDKSGELAEEQCNLLMKTEGRDGDTDYWLVQLQSEKTPDGAKARNRHRLLPAADNIGDLTATRWGIGNNKGDSLILHAKRREYSGLTVRGKKQGPGMMADKQGRMIYGVWDSDTLVSGRRHDGWGGVYEGSFNRDAVAQGHGIYDERDGKYYEGHWQNDKRNVFGFSLDPKKGMSVGEWQDDKYLGERVVYTADRIYGIDISKYQHEQKKEVITKMKVKKGKKTVWKDRKIIANRIYSIDWSKLRITSLGGHQRNAITGRTEFPVSFVYIKATEGTTILNGYYKGDYTAARQHGFRVGTYHFFSLRTAASDQARYFLANARFSSGDFPPVLDVEPTGDMIREIGGKEELVKRMLTWLRIVEKKVGVKPIIYVSQNFARKWLLDVPEIQDNYQVWIARYGEYKPDFKLIYWQLSPNGKVKGITGDVDINVFNGYGSQFEDFKLNSCIP